MFDFFKTSRPQAAPHGTASGTHDRTAVATSVAGDLSSPHVVRDLVGTVLGSLLRQQQIPPDWLRCEVSMMDSQQRPRTCQVRLVVERWHEDLMRQAPALQQQLAQTLRHFDPSGANEYSIDWTFSARCTSLPTASLASSEWVGSCPAPLKFDLPDRPRKAQAIEDDFAPTEPSTFA